MHGRYQMSMCKGPFKSLYLQIFSDTIMQKDNPEYNFNSSDWNVIYREPHPDLRAIQNSVIDLCKRDITHELFGLTYVDLMEMDYPTFSRLRKTILELCKEKQEEIKNIKENILSKNKEGN